VALPLLPTSLVGSYALPGWLHAGMEKEAAGAFGVSDAEEMYLDATRVALADQREAGVDILCDGEYRRRHFILNFFRRFEGVTRLEPLRKVGSAAYDMIPRFRLEGRLAARGGLGIVEEHRILRGLAGGAPVKICCPGALTLSRPVAEIGDYRERGELLSDMAGIVNGELRALAGAGADYIQIDEPRFSHHDGEMGEIVALLNQMTRGVRARIALHVCFGNYFNKSLDERTYRRLFPALLESGVAEFCLEFANRNFVELEIAREIAEAGKTLGFGCVDVKSCWVEPPQFVAGQIRRLLEAVPPERVRVIPDCGFNHTARPIAQAKMAAMVEGARIVRRELAG